MVAKRVFYDGRVQGVGFRFSVREIATGYDVSGWIKNLADGRVQLEVQGAPEELEAFLGAIQQSHLRAHIHRHVVHEITPDPALRGFGIRH
jgi:acylphosphatase